MSANWNAATEQLVRHLADLGENRVLAIEPDDGQPWSQVIRKRRDFFAEVQSNEYLIDSGPTWTDRQHTSRSVPSGSASRGPFGSRRLACTRFRRASATFHGVGSRTTPTLLPLNGLHEVE